MPDGDIREVHLELGGYLSICQGVIPLRLKALNYYWVIKLIAVSGHPFPKSP